MSSFTLVTGGYDSSIRFFDATNQSLERTINFPDQQVLRVAFSSDSPVSHDAPLFLIAGGSPSVCVFDVSRPNNTPNIFQVHQGHTEAITAVGFEPRHSAFVFSASEDGTLQTWLPKLSPTAVHHPYSVNAPPSPIPHPMASGAFLPDGRMRFETVPASMRNLDDSSTPVAIHDAIYFPPSNYFFTVDANGRFRVWAHTSSRTPLTTLIPHSSKRNLQCIELSTDYTKIVMANFDGFVFIYYVDQVLSFLDNPGRTKPVPIIFRANNHYIPRIRLSVSGANLVCTTFSGAIKLFRMTDITAHSSSNTNMQTQGSKGHEVIESITPLREFTGQRGSIWDAAFVEDRDDYLFTCSNNMQVMLWSLVDLQSCTEYVGHSKGVVCLAVRERMSPDVPPEQLDAPPEYEYTQDQAMHEGSSVTSNGEPSESGVQATPPVNS